MKPIRKDEAERAHGDRFDAVAWVRRRRDAMYAETAELSPEELVAYVQRVAGENPDRAGQVSSSPRPA